MAEFLLMYNVGPCEQPPPLPPDELEAVIARYIAWGERMRHRPRVGPRGRPPSCAGTIPPSVTAGASWSASSPERGACRRLPRETTDGCESPVRSPTTAGRA
jgi:hypothetical protein